MLKKCCKKYSKNIFIEIGWTTFFGNFDRKIGWKVWLKKLGQKTVWTNWFDKFGGYIDWNKFVKKIGWLEKLGETLGRQLVGQNCWNIVWKNWLEN